MTLRPCLDCGEPTETARCDEHASTPTQAPTARRGYDHRWRLLSERARRLQPWCSDCGTTADLTADHLPTAWERRNAGLPVRNPSCACGWAADRGFDSPWAASVAWAGHIFDRSHQEAT